MFEYSRYLEQRLKKLEPIIKELIPHNVEFENLQINGVNPLNSKQKILKNYEDKENLILTNQNLDYTWVNPEIDKSPPNEFLNYDDDVLASYEDVVDEPIFGPCVIFGGQTAHWTEAEPTNYGVMALESRLNFETKANKRVLATFEIFNAGTCAIYYDWKVGVSM